MERLLVWAWVYSTGVALLVGKARAREQKMTKEDWIRKGKGNSAKYEMPMSYWAENHFDNKDDWVCLHGGIYKDKRGVLKIQCMPV